MNPLLSSLFMYCSRASSFQNVPSFGTGPQNNCISIPMSNNAPPSTDFSWFIWSIGGDDASHEENRPQMSLMTRFISSLPIGWDPIVPKKLSIVPPLCAMAPESNSVDGLCNNKAITMPLPADSPLITIFAGSPPIFSAFSDTNLRGMHSFANHDLYTAPCPLCFQNWKSRKSWKHKEHSGNIKGDVNAQNARDVSKFCQTWKHKGYSGNIRA